MHSQIMEIKFNSSFDKSNDSEFNRFEKSQSFLDHFRLINVYVKNLINSKFYFDSKQYFLDFRSSLKVSFTGILILSELFG